MERECSEYLLTLPSLSYILPFLSSIVPLFFYRIKAVLRTRPLFSFQIRCLTNSLVSSLCSTVSTSLFNIYLKHFNRLLCSIQALSFLSQASSRTLQLTGKTTKIKNLRSTTITHTQSKMPFFKSSLSGPGYIVLNVIRVCNIIALLAIVAASFCMLIKTFVVSKFFFFDGVSHVITGCLARKYLLPSFPISKTTHQLTTLHSRPDNHRNRPLPPLHSQQLAPPLHQLRLHNPRRPNDSPRRLCPWQPQQNSHLREVPRHNLLATRHRFRHRRLPNGHIQHLRKLHVPPQEPWYHCPSSPRLRLHCAAESRCLAFSFGEDAKERWQTLIPS